jgi:hypothetical protein
MLSQIDVKEVLFLDIETVPQYGLFEELPDNLKILWEKKSAYFRTEEQQPAEVYSRAGIYAEFGKIICISVGLVNVAGEIPGIRIKSYAGSDEKELLLEFKSMIKRYATDRLIFLCAHNGKEFDFPYLARRMLVNGISLPELLDIAGKKPWEVRHLDTMELWKFGDYKHYTSLELLTAIFGIPSPKQDIDGSKVADVFWKEKNLPRIVEYCEHDVVAIIQLLLKYKGMPVIDEKHIEIVKG